MGVLDDAAGCGSDGVISEVLSASRLLLKSLMIVSLKSRTRVSHRKPSSTFAVALDLSRALLLALANSVNYYEYPVRPPREIVRLTHVLDAYSLIPRGKRSLVGISNPRGVHRN